MARAHCKRQFMAFGANGQALPILHLGHKFWPCTTCFSPTAMMSSCGSIALLRLQKSRASSPPLMKSTRWPPKGCGISRPTTPFAPTCCGDLVGSMNRAKRMTRLLRLVRPRRSECGCGGSAKCWATRSAYPNLPWQCLYFLPEPHGQTSLRPTLPQLVGSFALRSGLGCGAANMPG